MTCSISKSGPLCDERCIAWTQRWPVNRSIINAMVNPDTKEQRLKYGIRLWTTAAAAAGYLAVS